jgi:hypothetical protein
MAVQPLYVLAEISDDPVKAWRSGDRAVINQLAELELRRNGLRIPDTLRAVSSEASIGDRGRWSGEPSSVRAVNDHEGG